MIQDRIDDHRVLCAGECGEHATVIASLPAPAPVVFVLLCDEHSGVVTTLGAAVRPLGPPRLRLHA